MTPQDAVECSASGRPLRVVRGELVWFRKPLPVSKSAVPPHTHTRECLCRARAAARAGACCVYLSICVAPVGLCVAARGKVYICMCAVCGLALTIKGL